MPSSSAFSPRTPTSNPECSLERGRGLLVDCGARQAGIYLKIFVLRAVEQHGAARYLDVKTGFAEPPRGEGQKALELRQAAIIGQSHRKFAVLAVGLAAVLLAPVTGDRAGARGITAEVVHQVCVYGLLDGAAARARFLQLERRKQETHVFSQGLLAKLHRCTIPQIRMTQRQPTAGSEVIHPKAS